MNWALFFFPQKQLFVSLVTSPIFYFPNLQKFVGIFLIKNWLNNLNDIINE
jgi:hypothetical protein